MAGLTIRVHRSFGNPTSLRSVQMDVDSSYGSKSVSPSAMLSTNLTASPSSGGNFSDITAMRKT
jgi:hypothetical protein